LSTAWSFRLTAVFPHTPAYKAIGRAIHETENP
jgi:hypothetical protein